MGRRQDLTREPCPDRIIEDAGIGFSVGLVGGTFYSFMRGIYTHPRGERISGGLQSVRMSAGKFAGRWAVWSSLFSASDCALVYLRQKEDPWNSIFAGATTGGILDIRKGMRSSVRSAIACAGLLALIEGGGIMFQKFVANADEMFVGADGKHLDNAGSGTAISDQTVPVQEIQTEKLIPKGNVNVSRRWFQRSKQLKKEGGGDSETKILESFDAPPMPTFEFK